MDTSSEGTIASRLTRATKRVGKSQNWLAEQVGIPQSTFNRQVSGNALSAETVARAAVALGVDVRWLLTGEAEEGPGGGGLNQWLETVEHTVRFAGGSQNLTAEERRRIQRDVLSGVIRLGKAEGKDVARLEAMLRELGPAPTETRITVADVYQLYKDDVAAARDRAAGLKELAIAARIAEEEGARRNERLERIERAAEPQPALPTRELLDLDAAEAAGSEPLPTAPGEESRRTG